MLFRSFAPSSKLIANGFVWESTALQKVKNKEWDFYWYNKCNKCNRLFVQARISKEPPVGVICPGCETPITKLKLFVTPIFGFLTHKDQELVKPDEYRPKNQFSSRPFFIDSRGGENTVSLKAGNIEIEAKYSEYGELLVLCEGIKGAGFFICNSCGHGETHRPKEVQHYKIGRAHV